MSELNDMCLTPEFKRDFNWERKFLDSFVQGKVELIKEQPQQGPDGWPYLYVKTASNDEQAEPVLSLLDWLKDKGVGLVVNPQKELPDYIFTYGMIWNFSERNLLVEATDDADSEESVVFNEGDNVFFGSPSKELLPDHVKGILLEFFGQQGVSDPRVAIVGKSESDYDLCFSLESIGSPPEEEHQGILEALSWFLPTHYGLMLLSEEAVSEFFSLKELLD